jgi:sugar-specific transcriptional regulator TrmB
VDKIINLLKSFNFTESESKVYISLLKNGSGTGYEISKNSSVPRSKVYNILEMLIHRGCVVVSKHTNPVNYSAVPVDEFIDNIKMDVEQSLGDIKTELLNYNQPIDLDNMWYIREYQNIFNKCRHLLNSAKTDVYIQVWKEDIHNIYEELKHVQERLDKVVIILYSASNDYEVDLKSYYRHGFEQKMLEESGGRWINIVVDSKEVIYGHIQNEKNAEIIWTESTPMVFLAKENIRHDAYCLKLIEALDEDTKNKFGNGLLGIREIFKGTKPK